MPLFLDPRFPIIMITTIETNNPIRNNISNWRLEIFFFKFRRYESLVKLKKIIVTLQKLTKPA